MRNLLGDPPVESTSIPYPVRTDWREYLRSQEALALMALLLMVALRFVPVWTQGKLYAPFRDNVFIYGPMFSEAARIALHGSFPFYLPSFGAGFPLFQSPHFSPAYPFYFFGFLDYGGPLQVLYTLTSLTIFHRFILALNLFVMLRCGRVSPWASFIGASVGVFAGNTEVYAGWITIMSSYTWLPLVMAGCILLLRNPARLTGALLLGGGAGMLALASASQAVAHAFYFCLIFLGSYIIWLSWYRRWRLLFQLVRSLLISGVIAFGVGSVSAVPVFLGIKGMIRHLGGGFVLGHQPIPWDKFNLYQLSLSQMAGTLISPRWVDIVGSPYVGPLGVGGVLLSFLLFRRLGSFHRFLVLIVGFVGLYALLSSCGTNSGFAIINYHLPLLNRIREAGRHLVLFTMATVLLTGIGFDQLYALWLRRRESRAAARLVYLLGGGLVVLFVGSVIWEMTKNSPLEKSGFAIFLLGPVLAGVALLVRAKAGRSVVFAAAIVSIASAMAPTRTFTLAQSEYLQRENLRSIEVLSDLRDSVGLGDFRIDFVDKTFSPMTWGMNASFFGYESFYDRLTPQPYDQFRMMLDDRFPVLREMMGARYLICAPDEKPLDALAMFRQNVGDYKLFENPQYMKRLQLIHQLAGTYANEKSFPHVAGLRFDFLRSAYVLEKDAKVFRPFLGARLGAQSDSGDYLQIVESSTNHVAAVVKSTTAGVLILNEWYVPAWKATVNGARSTTHRINQWQVGLRLAAGRNVVEFTYRPSLAWDLLILNRLTLALLFLVLMAGLLWPSGRFRGAQNLSRGYPKT